MEALAKSRGFFYAINAKGRLIAQPAFPIKYAALYRNFPV